MNHERYLLERRSVAHRADSMLDAADRVPLLSQLPASPKYAVGAVR